jgi:replicative DNA helicase
MKSKIKFNGLAQHNITSERAILGGCINSVDVAENALPQLNEAHFYDPICLEVYKAIRTVHLSGGFIAPSSVKSALLKNGFQSIVDNHFEQIHEDGCYFGEMDYHIAELDEMKVKRHLAVTMGKLMSEMSTMDSVTAINKLSELMFTAQDGATANPSLTPKEIIQREADRPQLSRMITGVHDLDAYYNDAGLYPGHVLVTLADSGHGKTHFAMYQSALLAKKGYKVHWFQLEDMDIKTANYFEKRIPEHTDNILINANLTDIESIKAEIRRVKREFDTNYVVIDYIQNVETTHKERTNEVEYASRQLTMLAKELRVTMHLLSQVTIDYTRRTGWKGEPQFNDVRWSRQLKQDAHHTNVIFRPSNIDGLLNSAQDKALDWNNREVELNSVFLKSIKIRGGEQIFRRLHLIHLPQGLEIFECHRKETELRNNAWRYNEIPTPF